MSGQRSTAFAVFAMLALLAACVIGGPKGEAISPREVKVEGQPTLCYRLVRHRGNVYVPMRVSCEPEESAERSAKDQRSKEIHP